MSRHSCASCCLPLKSIEHLNDDDDDDNDDDDDDDDDDDGGRVDRGRSSEEMLGITHPLFNSSIARPPVHNIPAHPRMRATHKTESRPGVRPSMSANLGARRTRVNNKKEIMPTQGKRGIAERHMTSCHSLELTAVSWAQGVFGAPRSINASSMR